MTAEQIAACADVLRAAGITEFEGWLECKTETGGFTDSKVTLKLGPRPPAPVDVPAGIPTGVALQAQERTRPPLPPELAAFMTAELQADLTATLED